MLFTTEDGVSVDTANAQCDFSGLIAGTLAVSFKVTDTYSAKCAEYCGAAPTPRRKRPEVQEPCPTVVEHLILTMQTLQGCTHYCPPRAFHTRPMTYTHSTHAPNDMHKTNN